MRIRKFSILTACGALSTLFFAVLGMTLAVKQNGANGRVLSYDLFVNLVCLTLMFRFSNTNDVTNG